MIDAKDVEVQSGGSERRGSGDVRVVDAFSRAGGGVMREAAGERKRVDVTRGKPWSMGKGEVRRDAKDRRNGSSWQDDRELVKDRIHVNGIPPEVGEHELGDFFSAFGRFAFRLTFHSWGIELCTPVENTFKNIPLNICYILDRDG